MFGLLALQQIKKADDLSLICNVTEKKKSALNSPYLTFLGLISSPN
jgi:hypothetical protein